MACISYVFKNLCMFLLVVAVPSRSGTWKIFDVRKYGAKGDGKTDNVNVHDINFFYPFNFPMIILYLKTPLSFILKLL